MNYPFNIQTKSPSFSQLFYGYTHLLISSCKPCRKLRKLLQELLARSNSITSFTSEFYSLAQCKENEIITCTFQLLAQYKLLHHHLSSAKFHLGNFWCASTVHLSANLHMRQHLFSVHPPASITAQIRLTQLTSAE